jgi:hypothetical protein
MIPVTIQRELDSGNEMAHLMDTPDKKLTDPSLFGGWTNSYREDDFSATAYFYLDKPASNLPDLPGVELRTAELRAGDFKPAAGGFGQ